MSGLSSSQNTFGLPGNKFGLVDKQRDVIGLTEKNLDTSQPSVTERENLMMFDTRDCIGELSLFEAQLAFSYETATKGKINPENFKRSLNSDGTVNPSKLVEVVYDLNISGFPERKPGSPYIKGNEISFSMPTVLRLIKSLEIINAIIPRDLIPMYVYFSRIYK